jgi:hypothetical protein
VPFGRLYHVTTPCFSADLVERYGVVVDASSPLDWLIGQPLRLLRAHCTHKGWQLERINTGHPHHSRVKKVSEQLPADSSFTTGPRVDPEELWQRVSYFRRLAGMTTDETVKEVALLLVNEYEQEAAAQSFEPARTDKTATGLS